MAYCTIDDVNGLIAKYNPGETTQPTTAQSEEFIELIYGKINTVLLSKGYTVPVTTPDSFLLALKLLNIQGAAAMILMSMFPGATGRDSTPMWKSLHDIFQAGMEALRNGEMPIALGKSGTGGMGSLYTSPSTNQSTYPDPVFSISPNNREF
jgi:hypothetical protein